MSLADINARVASACKAAGRSASSVTLVAVSKMQPAEKVQAVLDAGHRTFGENRVQDAWETWGPLREKYSNLSLHLIGGLQTNKVKEAVALFDVIQTVDREKLAAEIAEEREKQKRAVSCFIQVNTGEEPQKGGVAPRDLEKLYRFCTEEAKLDIRGLMCIPPVEDIPGLHFALLHKLAGQLGLKGLSMGMSADFETAIRYGATHVRVGSALFGAREAV